MRRRFAWTSGLALALALLPAAAQEREGVAINARRGQLTIENHSLAEIFYFVVEGERNSLAVVPVSSRGMGLAVGESRDFDTRRIAPGAAVQVNWWHQGTDVLDAGPPRIFGPDRVRTVLVRLP